MKRLLLTLTALLTFFGAQSQVLYSEDFDGISGPTAGGAGTYAFPPGFLLRNVENSTPAAAVAYVNEAWERREDFNFSVVDSAAFSTSWYSPAATANDWMWTPLVGPIPANTVLRWNGVTYDPDYRDGYEVRIMTSTQGPPTGGSGSIGNQLTNSTVVYSTAAENTTWTAHEIPLAAYAGQSIYIGFRNNSTDKFLLLIDDIQVVHIVNNDLRVVSGTVGHGEYTKAPSSHLTTTQNIQLQGSIQNMGLMAATNARLACDVLIDGVYSSTVQSAATASFASGATEVKTISYTPTVDGDYDFRFYPMMDVADEESVNDTVYDPTGLVVDPTEMRRDDGTVAGALGIGAGVTGYIGQTYNFETAVNIESIKTTFTVGYTGRRLAAVIYATDGAGVPTTFIASTDTLLYVDDAAATYTQPMHGGTLNLPAGEYGIFQVEFANDSTLAVANTLAIFRTNSVYVQWATSPFGAGFTPVESFNIPDFNRPFMIAPQFDMCVGETGGSVANTTQAGCGMNDGSAEVTLDPGYTITWEDMTTNPINASLGAGFHTYTLVNAYCTIIDSVEITNPNAPTASAMNVEDADCFGEEGSADLDIQGGTAPYTVTWSNGEMGTQLTDIAGTYSATIVDDANCSVTVSGVVIAEPTELVSTSTGTDETCDACADGEATVTPSGGTAPYTYLWSNGGTTQTISNLPPDTYTVTVTDANGCTTTDSFTVNEFVGLNELANDGIIVYPNPVVDFLALEAKKNNVTGAVLIDASGRMICELTQTNNTFTADMRMLAKGVYQLVIGTTEGTIVTSVAKQ